MIIIVFEELEAEIRLLKKQKNYIMMRLQKLPEGTLVIHKNGKYAEQLAEATFYRLKLEELGEQQRFLEQILACSHSRSKTDLLFASNAEYEQLFHPPANADASEWAQQPYERCSKHPENLIHKSLTGNLLRSKSEAFIDFSLSERNIPYHYEAPLVLNGTTYYPDFTIMHPVTHKLYYWEHLGMMDDPQYAAEAFRKLRIYANNGIYPMINLIVTSETKTSPFTMDMAERVIQMYFG